jgi:hypothetical protein
MEQNLPGTYRGQPHPIIKHDLECTKCKLGVIREHLNSKQLEIEEDKRQPVKRSVPGAGPDDLTKVRLILISDYPGHYEEQFGYPQYDILNSKEPYNKGLLQARNSGCFIRLCLNRMYGLDTYNEVWITNVVKCNPNQCKVVENTHVKPCAGLWLSSELSLLDEYCPTAPLLIAGQQAFRAIKMLYKAEAPLLNELGLNGCRRRNDIRLGKRPAVFAPNPVRAARSEFRIETQIGFSKGGLGPTGNRWLYPAPIGSPVHSLIEDLKFLRDFI